MRMLMIMDLLTTRRLIASILPLISLGLIIGALAVDDWYSVSHTEGIRDPGEIWEHHETDYGIQEFRYLKLWSGIFGDSYYQQNSTYQGQLGDIFSYVLNSSLILTVLHLPLILFCVLVTADRSKPWIPMVLSLIIFLGIISSAVYFHQNIEEEINDHIDSSLEPLEVDLNEDIREGLKGSGSIGPSFYLLASSSIFPLFAFLLLIQTRSEKPPSSRQIEDGFFKE